MSTMINSISDNTQQLKNDWALSLMDKGVIVKLYISRWRGVAQLDPNQFGLKFNNDSVSFMKDYIVFGYESLLPSKIKKEIDAIDIKARLTLKEYSFETLWGRFVPFIAFEHWKKENDIIREKYLKIAKSIYDNYDDIINIGNKIFKDIKEKTGQIIEGIVIRSKYSNALSCKYINSEYDDRNK